MTRTAALIVLVAASTAFADDDPDLFVVSGKVADDHGAPAVVQLDRRISSGRSWRTDWSFRKTTVPQGGEFRFTGLPPGRYDLIVDRETRTIDVFDDVPGLSVRASPPADARLVGRLTLGFEGDAANCTVRVDRVETKAAADGSFVLSGVPAGEASVVAVYSPPRSTGPRRADLHVLRRFPIVLQPGDNRLDARLTPNEAATVAVRSSRPWESFEGRILDRDPGAGDEWGAPFRVRARENGAVDCFSIRAGGIDSTWWENVGGALPLPCRGRGQHRVRVEAAGFFPCEREFDVTGPTRVDVELTPLPGGYVVFEPGRSPLFVDERRADGTWTELFTRDARGLPSGAGLTQPTRVFLTPGVHVVRAATPDSPPSAVVELKIGDDRAETPAPTFAFAKGLTLSGSLVTKAGTSLAGFDVRVFRLDGTRWDHIRAQDTFATPGFNVAGLAKGRYRLAFDEAGARVFGEFEIDDADREIEFTLRSR